MDAVTHCKGRRIFDHKLDGRNDLEGDGCSIFEGTLLNLICETQ